MNKDTQKWAFGVVRSDILGQKKRCERKISRHKIGVPTNNAYFYLFIEPSCKPKNDL